jgi:hypothetical protein
MKMRKAVDGILASLQLMAMPVAELGTVAAGDSGRLAASGLYWHCVLLPVTASFKANPTIANEL